MILFFHHEKYFESVLIPCKFNVLFFKMIIISNHNQIFFFHIFMFSCMVNYFFLTQHVHFTPFMCGKGLLKF
jgi:hypothetical protein